MHLDSRKFEELTAEIFRALRNNSEYETVDHDVMLVGYDGPRQIDVVVRGKVGPIDTMAIVECKDYGKIVTVEVVDQTHSKMMDVKANQAIIVSRKGFSKTAIQKAKRLGIQLFTAHAARSEKWAIQFQIPVVVEEITPALSPRFEIEISSDVSKRIGNKLPPLDLTAYRPLVEAFNVCWISNQNNQLETDNEFEWIPPRSLEQLPFLKDGNGYAIPIHNLKVAVNLKRKFYFGFLNELENSKVLQSITEEKATVIFDLEKIMDYRKQLMLYDSFDDLPRSDVPTIKFVASSLIETSQSQSGTVTITRTK